MSLARLPLCLLTAFFCLLSACSEPQAPDRPDPDTPAADELTPTHTLVDAIAADDDFSTFAGALQAANLENTLRGPGPFTLFVPTNDAFATLPEGTLANLLIPENNEELTSRLLHHVANGKILSADMKRMGTVETAFGSSLPVTAPGDQVQIGEAQIVTVDMETDNGVIHVIDAVLLPPSMPQ